MSEQAVLTAARYLLRELRADRAAGQDLTPPTLQAIEALKEIVKVEMAAHLPPEQDRT